MIESEGEAMGRPLAPGDPLPFRCHAGLACFNACCRDKRLPLLPYDVLRLVRGLQVRSDAFLEEHAELEIDPPSGWPALRLRLRDDGRCPFVTDAGCGVYPHRPTCCRIYPLARAVKLGADGAPRETFLAPPTIGTCLGFGAEGTSSVEAWARGQGLDPYRAANDRAARLFLHPRRRRPLALEEGDLHLAILVLYNPDVFRELVATPGFATRAGVGPARVERALASDDGLLDFGQAWLAERLFG